MKTVGIICEYNPFHLGHARQLRLIREQLGQDCRIVCVMSGNYVQRGEPAMWDKYTRARAAVAGGADLVLELPITGVLQSAEGFARTGVEILTRLGCVDYLSFGAECGSGEMLQALAARMDQPDFQAALRRGLDAGLSYAAARQQALGDQAGILTHPNNILGLEYCRAIQSLGSALQPLVITRTGDYHAPLPDHQAPSATSVRQLVPHGPWQTYVPAEVGAILADAPWYAVAHGERAMLARLRAMDDAQWAQCAHGSEGLWSKAMKAARTQPDWESILQAMKSKRYPRTRLQRLLLCAYLGISAEDLLAPFPHVRILAASEAGRSLLRQAKKSGSLPLRNPGEAPTEQERRTSDLHTLFAAPGCPTPCQTEQTARLWI